MQPCLFRLAGTPLSHSWIGPTPPATDPSQAEGIVHIGALPQTASPVRLLLKDLGIIHDEAKAGQVPLLLGALAEQRFLEASGRGLADEDISALVKLWEEPAGVTVDRPRRG